MLRRKDRERDRAFAYGVIDRCTHGVAAFAAGDGAPYCVPLSMVRIGDELYFHCAPEGRKTNLLRARPRVCVSFVAEDAPFYDAARNSYSTYYQSAVVSGPAFEVTEPARKTAVLRALCEKLTPENLDGFDRAAARSLGATAVWGVRMEEASGKEKARPDGMQRP